MANMNRPEPGLLHAPIHAASSPAGSDPGAATMRAHRVLLHQELEIQLSLGKGCHTVYEAREVIDPANEDYRLYVARET